MNDLLSVAERIGSGSLTERAEVVRQDEIGRISSASSAVCGWPLFVQRAMPR